MMLFIKNIPNVAFIFSCMLEESLTLLWSLFRGNQALPLTNGTYFHKASPYHTNYFSI